MTWLHAQGPVFTQIGLIVLAGLVLFQGIKFSDRVGGWFRKVHAPKFFGYQSGHGRHALANPLRSYALVV